MKTVVFFDVDGTLIRGNVNALTYYYLLKERFFSPFFVVHAIFWVLMWKLGIYDNIGGVARGAARELAGLSEKAVIQTTDHVFSRALAKRIYKKAKETIEYHRKEGHDIVLLSGSFEPFIKMLGSHMSISSVIGTKLEQREGMYTGRIAGAVVGLAKCDIVTSYIKEHQYEYAYAYSDHYRDIAMMEKVQAPIAVNPDFWLRRVAKRKGWKILEFDS